MKVEKTKNYSLFHTVSGNRPINNSHVVRLARSIEALNLLEQNPIIVDNNFCVIDGQHRLIAAMQLGEAIYYTKTAETGLTPVHLLNVNTKPWSMQDYLASYITQGQRDYMILKDYLDQTGLTLSIALMFLKGDIRNRGLSEHVRAFKEGRFTITDLAGANAWATYLKEIKPFTQPGVARDREFIYALMLMEKAVSRETFLGKLKQAREKIPRCAVYKDYLRVLEDIVNIRARKHIRLY